MKSFLLIVCTERLVTIYMVASDSPDIPAFSQILLRQLFHLRTVIVTAGVHQRLDSKLRPALLRGFTPPLNVLTLARHQLLYIALRLRRNLCFW